MNSMQYKILCPIENQAMACIQAPKFYLFYVNEFNVVGYKIALNFRVLAKSITRPLNLSLILLDYLQDAIRRRLRNVLLAECASSQDSKT